MQALTRSAPRPAEQLQRGRTIAVAFGFNANPRKQHLIRTTSISLGTCSLLVVCSTAREHQRPASVLRAPRIRCYKAGWVNLYFFVALPLKCSYNVDGRGYLLVDCSCVETVLRTAEVNSIAEARITRGEMEQPMTHPPMMQPPTLSSDKATSATAFERKYEGVNN